jgi:predicted regulator of Ras-like GTPase activity (Roadblock/LC7/MglB family)
MDMQEILSDLLDRVAGSRGAIIFDQDGVPIAHATQDPALDVDAVGAGCSLLLRDTLAAAERLAQGTVADILLEAERATVAMIPLKNACSLCLLLAPNAVVGRGLFEARKAAFTLDQAL